LDRVDCAWIGNGDGIALVWRADAWDVRLLVDARQGVGAGLV